MDIEDQLLLIDLNDSPKSNNSQPKVISKPDQAWNSLTFGSDYKNDLKREDIVVNPEKEESKKPKPPRND